MLFHSGLNPGIPVSRLIAYIIPDFGVLNMKLWCLEIYAIDLSNCKTDVYYELLYLICY